MNWGSVNLCFVFIRSKPIVAVNSKSFSNHQSFASYSFHAICFLLRKFKQNIEKLRMTISHFTYIFLSFNFIDWFGWKFPSWKVSLHMWDFLKSYFTAIILLFIESKSCKPQIFLVVYHNLNWIGKDLIHANWIKTQTLHVKFGAFTL